MDVIKIVQILGFWERLKKDLSSIVDVLLLSASAALTAQLLPFNIWLNAFLTSVIFTVVAFLILQAVRAAKIPE
jgi:hypothetical protein